MITTKMSYIDQHGDQRKNAHDSGYASDGKRAHTHVERHVIDGHKK